MEKLARQRISAATIPIEFKIGLRESLPFKDGSFDTVVTTLNSCTIDDGAVYTALRSCPGRHHRWVQRVRVVTTVSKLPSLKGRLSPEPILNSIGMVAALMR